MHRHSKHIVDLRNALPGAHIKHKSVPTKSYPVSHDVHFTSQVPGSKFDNSVPAPSIPTSQREKIIKQDKPRTQIAAISSQSRPSFIGDVFAQIKSAMQFVALTAVIFILLFGLSNFSAYKEIFNYWYKTEVIKADREETALDKVVQTLDKQDVQDLVLNQGKIAYVNFQVRPSDFRIYVPKINKNLPIVEPTEDNLINQNWDALEEDIQKGLRHGVVHYPGTANPGQVGNIFLTAHSSWYPNDPLPYGLSSAFSLLGQLVAGDNIYVFKDGQMYIYKVRDKYVVKPTNVEVLDQPTDKREMTLMTCTPVGTTLNRMIVKLDLIYPSYNGTDNEENVSQPNPYSDARLQA